MPSRRLVGCICLLLVLLTGCRSGAPAFPAYATKAEALGRVLNDQVSIVYSEPFGESRAVVLFRTSQHPGLSATLLELTALGKWRMTDPVGLGAAVPRVGALTYDRGSIGLYEEQVGPTRIGKAQAHLLFGEVLDPSITWVEVTLHEDGAQPIRATVSSGIWLVKLPPEKQNTWFDLRAGNDAGLRFAASLGRFPTPPRSSDASTAPLIEYLDRQQGISLQHPITGDTPQIDADGRLVIGFGVGTLTVARSPRQPGDQLQPPVATAPVLESGIRRLGTRDAGYLLEARPEAEGGGATYVARYLALTERYRYEVACATPHIHDRSVWSEFLEPICNRILTTIQLEDR